HPARRFAGPGRGQHGRRGRRRLGQSAQLDPVQLTPPRQPHRRIWLLLGWGMVATVVVLSLIPLEVDLSENRDKYAHLIAYGSMTCWFAMLFPGWVRRVAVVIAFAAMGVVIEYLQRMTGYRTFDVADMAANAMGAGLGWVLVQTPLGNALDWTERLLGRL